MSIDLRSDTVTQPTPAMRRAMAEAEVGDDVFGDDPTVQRLEAAVAGLLRKEAAVYVPSGTMANQLALRSQTQPGDQAVVEAGCHIYRYEGGAPAALSGLLLTQLESEAGLPAPETIEAAWNSADDFHQAPPALLCLENTHNRHGGRVHTPAALKPLCDAAHGRGLRTHLDGARLWNASVACGRPMEEFAASFDSVSVCFSKGLGAPIGSVLSADAATVQRARRLRKQWGGGMRQVGILAAACLHALEHHFERLADDHSNARLLAEGIDVGWMRLHAQPESNIVLFDLPEDLPSSRVQSALAERDLLVWNMGPRRLRMVTHLDVSTEQCERAVALVNAMGEAP